MNYIQTMRKLIGTAMLMTVGCGIIIEQVDQILLQHRKDRDVWGIPGAHHLHGLVNCCLDDLPNRV